MLRLAILGYLVVRLNWHGSGVAKLDCMKRDVCENDGSKVSAAARITAQFCFSGTSLMQRTENSISQGIQGKYLGNALRPPFFACDHFQVDVSYEGGWPQHDRHRKDRIHKAVEVCSSGKMLDLMFHLS